jgi:hypothetical protein
MSLYIRLQVGFFTSRKTVRLHAAIGESAFWLPPRLWCYAAENQPDGIFKDYSAEEIADVLSYRGDASSMLQALLQAGFMDNDPLRIHGWEEHNGYHKAFSERAVRAARARWDRQNAQTNVPPSPPSEDKTRKERRGEEASIASSIAQASTSNAPSMTTQHPPHQS